MDVEWEAKYINVDKDGIRVKLQETGATLVRPERLLRRTVFTPPDEQDIEGKYLRVRDEGGRVTMSLKFAGKGKIDAQKEVSLVVDDYETACQFLADLGCREKAYQETKREEWKLGKAEIAIDEWPFLEPYVEIEASSERGVKDASERLGFNYKQAVFGSAAQVLSKKYGISEDVINNKMPRLVFSGENPYLKWKGEH